MPQTACSGVIVDAKDLGAKAALMPSLFDESGRELYLGSLGISNDDLVARGPVSYVRSLSEAKAHSRVGDRPVIVRAKRFKGPFHADLILSPEDVKRLEGLQSEVLKRMAVVIVL